MTATVLERMSLARIVPVVTIERAAHARRLGSALIAGGLPLAEITFRTAAARDAIRVLRDIHPEILVGAGTVLDPETVDLAVDAGAAFIVAPGFSPRMVDHCLNRGVPVIPGVCTPTEIEQGLERGLTLLKFFPAEAAGGLALLTAMAAPYRVVRFMATGGINRQNLSDYLKSPWIAACGGTWLAPTADMTAGRFDDITTNVREAVALARTAPPNDK